MRSKLDFDQVVHADPSKRYTFKSYRTAFNKDYKKAVQNTNMPMLGLLISAFPFSDGKKGIDEKPLLVLGIDARKDFKRSVKRLLTGKEEALSSLDKKTVALLEVRTEQKEGEQTPVFKAKILRSKGSSSKLFRAYNKKLGRLYAPLEEQADEKRSEQEQGIQESDALDDSKFLKKLSGYIDDFRSNMDVEHRLAVSKTIVEKSAAWLKKKASKSDPAKVEQIKKAAAKFMKVYKKLRLEQELLEKSGMDEEWLDLYQTIKQDFKRYTTNLPLNPERFPFDERKEQLLGLVEDIEEWRNGFGAAFEANKSDFDETQKLLFQKHKERIDGIATTINQTHLPQVDKELEAAAVLEPIQAQLIDDWRSSQSTQNPAARLAFLYETQKTLQNLNQSLSQY